MLRNQWIRVVRQSMQGRQVILRSDVAQGYTNVSQKSSSFDSLHWGFPEKGAESLVAQIEIIAQGHADRCGTRGEGGFTRRLRETIPWTRIEAFIAAEDPVSNERPELGRDGSFQFDR